MRGFGCSGKQFREVHEGDLSRVEAMLLDQAHALQAVFTNLKPHERLDTGTPGAAIGADRAVETVGALNRS